MNDTATISPPGETNRHAAPDPLRKRALRIIKGTAEFEDRFFRDYQEAVQVIEELRSMGCIIGFTAGVWDFIHPGHARYISKGKKQIARLYPDAEHVIMVVGVDSDQLAKGRKGEERPIVPLDERAEMLDFGRPVDLIVAQNEPGQLYRVLPYHARVVSKSTTDLPDRAEMEKYCENLVVLEPQAETSTTARIRKLHLNGAGVLAEKIREAIEHVIDEELRGR